MGVEPEPLEPIDAGPVVDAGAAEPDAGVDAGLVTEDAGTLDAGALDAGTLDAGALDAGTVDAGVEDAGTSIVDAGSSLPDSGVDAGQVCICALPSYCASGVCVVDRTAPVITATASAGTTTGKLRVSGTALDTETGITTVSVRVNQGSALSVPVVMGAFSAELDTTDAEFTVVVTGRDAAANESSVQTTFDPTGPRITLTPADASCDSTTCTGANISSAATSFTVTATIDEFALASTSPVTIRVVTTTGTQLVPTTDMVRSGATWTWTWANLPTLNDTTVDFIVTARDAAQNVSSATVHGYLDRVGPPLSVTPTQDGACDQSGCTGAVITAATGSFVFAGTVDASSLRVRIRDGASVLVPSTDVSMIVGTWSWAWNSLPMADGRSVTAEFTATDMLGNTTTLSRVVLIDRVLPSLLIASPATGTLVGSATVSVSANAADGLGIKGVEVTTQPGGAVTSATLDANGDYVANVGVPVVDAVEQTLTVRAVDLVGNARSSTRRYVADRVAPVVTIGGTDFDCSGAECTGLVANRSLTSVGFTGTVTDGSAITLQKTIFGTSQVTTSTDPASSGAWSWAWSSLPSNVNGAAYELRVVATDAAGNASAPSVRRVWRDDVAPTVTILPAGQRNVSPTAPLLNFSERMVVDSVHRATGFSPPVGLATLSTTDGRTFAFASPAFAPYTSQRVVLTSATDLAGNQLATTGDGTFLTAPVARDAVTVIRPSIPGSTFRHPVVAVDSDQQLYVSYLTTTASGATVESMVFDGTGASRSKANVWGIPAREGELRIVGETRGSDQRLTATLEHSVVFGYGAGPTVGYGAQTMAWTGTGYDSTSFLIYSAGPTVGGTPASVDLVRPTHDWMPSPLGTRRTFVAPNNGATAMSSFEQNGSTWSTTSPAALSNFRRLDGRASVEATAALGQFRVRYFDFGAMSEVGTFGFVRAATGQPATKTVDRFLTTVATSGSFVAWMNDTQLTIACSPAPFAATPVWRPTALSMPQTQTSSLTSVKDATRVVFASEFGGNVFVHSTPLNGCAAAPVLTQLGVLPGLKEPNVFIDARGTVWVAGIANDGSVVAHRL